MLQGEFEHVYINLLILVGIFTREAQAEALHKFLRSSYIARPMDDSFLITIDVPDFFQVSTSTAVLVWISLNVCCRQGLATQSRSLGRLRLADTYMPWSVRLARCISSL